MMTNVKEHRRCWQEMKEYIAHIASKKFIHRLFIITKLNIYWMNHWNSKHLLENFVKTKSLQGVSTGPVPSVIS